MTAADIWAVILLVGGSFAATNVDNLVLLVVLMGAEPQKRPAAALGFVTSAMAILSVAGIGAVLGATLDPGVVGYVGAIPICLGLFLLYRQFRSGGFDAASEQETARAASSTGWLASFTLMFSNSGDSLAIFLPLLAESDRDSVLWEVSIFLVMALLWVGLAWRIAGQPDLARRIEAVGTRLVPWIMISAGLYILMDTGTDTLVVG